MAIPLYLAMTAAEFSGCEKMPEKIAWMACHFSSYGTSLSNLPRTLPEGSLLILNDRTPVHGHDKLGIADDLARAVDALGCCGLLLDFQRPESEETAAIVKALLALPYPVCVSECYAKELDCPVFLPPVPPHVPIKEYLAPWSGREIWLEAALEGEELTLTESGCRISVPGEPIDSPEHRDAALFCHYRIAVEERCARFSLYRSRDDLTALLDAAQALGVTRTVGLWQELHWQESCCPDTRLSNADASINCCLHD